MSLVLPLLGIILNTQMFKYQVDSLMAVTEQFLNDRWIILYHLSQGQYVVFARYMLFDTWNNLEHITKRVHHVVDVGISLENPAQYLVVEQTNIRCRLLYLFQENHFHLLKQYDMEPTYRGLQTLHEEIS